MAKAISSEGDSKDVKFSNVLNHIGDRFSYRNATQKFVESNPELAKIISDPNASPEAKQEARQVQLNYLAKELRVDTAEVLAYMSDDISKVAGQSNGMITKEENSNRIFLNYGTDSNITEVLGHETSHLIDKANEREYGEGYADIMGRSLNDAVSTEFALAEIEKTKTTNQETWDSKYQNNNLIKNNSKLASTLENGEVYQDTIFHVERSRAGGNGHMSLYYQNEKKEWNRIDQYTSGRTTNIGLLLNKGYKEEISIRMVDNIELQAIKKSNDSVYIKTSFEQDKKISAAAIKKSKTTDERKYRLWTNNCADAVQDVVKKGNIKTPIDINPKPNTIFDNIKKYYEKKTIKNII